MTYQVTVYQSGNSKVITIPSKLEVNIGDQFSLEKKHDQIIMQKTGDTKKATLHQQLISDTGNLNGWNQILDDVDKLEEFLENTYE